MTGGSLSDGKVISVKNLSPIKFEEFCDMEYPEKNPGLIDVLKLYAERSVAKNFFCSFRSVRSLEITPLLSTMTIFSRRAPRETYNLVQETADAPAPLTTI